MPDQTYKASYTIPCSSAFRDSVTDLARRRNANVADLARSILLLIPEDALRRVPDPGGPLPGDRERTVLKSGPAEGRPWRRKPRLQVRLAPGYEIATVRRALNFALALDRGERTLSIRSTDDPPAADAVRMARLSAEVARLAPFAEEVERLRAAVATLAFRPISGGVRTRSEALYVLGFAPGEFPDRDAVRARFRTLATIHHPDSATGNHLRMSQLNAAVSVLSEARSGVR